MSMETYSGLKASIANWLNRTDLSAEIPDFIALVESRLAHELRIPSIEKTAYIITDTHGRATIPADFLEIKDVFFNDKPVDRVSLGLLSSQTVNSGIPTIFAREANEFRFHPIPTISVNDKLKVIYYYKVPPLSDTAPTNDLLKTVPELYLYGALSEAAKFLGADDSRWEAGYQTAYGRVVSHTRQAEVSGTTQLVLSGY
jgi:hypothetical protein